MFDFSEYFPKGRVSIDKGSVHMNNTPRQKTAPEGAALRLHLLFPSEYICTIVVVILNEQITCESSIVEIHSQTAHASVDVIALADDVLSEILESSSTVGPGSSTMEKQTYREITTRWSTINGEVVLQAIIGSRFNQVYVHFHTHT